MFGPEVATHSRVRKPWGRAATERVRGGRRFAGGRPALPSPRRCTVVPLLVLAGVALIAYCGVWAHNWRRSR